MTVVNLVDVDEIIIGGEHFRAVEQIFLPIIRDTLTAKAFRRFISATKVTVSSLEAANAVGAAALVFQSLLRSGAQRPPAAARPLTPFPARNRITRQQ